MSRYTYIGNESPSENKCSEVMKQDAILIRGKSGIKAKGAISILSLFPNCISFPPNPCLPPGWIPLIGLQFGLFQQLQPLGND